MAAIHHTAEYRACVREMKARGRYQRCITAGQSDRCPVMLDALARKGHPLHMTLGHIIAVDAGGAPYDPRNYGPQCGPCNYTDGAIRGRAKQLGRLDEIIASPDWK